MPGPFGKDVPYSQKVGAARPARESNVLRIASIVINLLGSYFVFNVESSLLLKLLVFGLSMSVLCITFYSEESQTKFRSENSNAERSKLENPCSNNGESITEFLSSTFSLSMVAMAFLTTVNNLINISQETLITIVIFFACWLVFMYVYFDRFANRKKKWRNIL